MLPQHLLCRKLVENRHASPLGYLLEYILDRKGNFIKDPAHWLAESLTGFCIIMCRLSLKKFVCSCFICGTVTSALHDDHLANNHCSHSILNPKNVWCADNITALCISPWKSKKFRSHSIWVWLWCGICDHITPVVLQLSTFTQTLCSHCSIQQSDKYYLPTSECLIWASWKPHCR